MKFRNFEELLKIVKGRPNRMVVPGANNREVMEACKMGQEYGLVSGGVFIGPRQPVLDAAEKAGIDLDKFELVDSQDPAEMCNLAAGFIRQGKGDFLLKGLVETKFYMKAVLNRETGLVEHGTALSHVVLFETSHYHKLFALADAAIFIKPTLDEKKKIIENTVRIMRMLVWTLPGFQLSARLKR
ncbi:MAG: phosphate acyltransferase [bacterium]